jgi:predicted DNA-binding transcriptional regulator YafY
MSGSLPSVLAPTARLLELLEMLQGRPLVSGGEIAARLGIDRRTVRRDVAALKELGIPVEGERGVGGGYRLRPGYRLPPLMLSDDEATVVVLGLLAAGRLGLDSATPSLEGALAKIHRVLPDELRRRVEALEGVLGFTAPAVAGAAVAGDVVLSLAAAIRRRRRVRVHYRSFDGAESERDLSPHGVVVHSGRWYLAGHDHGRADLRTFRVDRIGRLDVTDEPAVPPPTGFDPVEHVTRALAQVPWPWEVEVRLDLPPGEAARRLPPTVAELGVDGEGTVMLMRVSSLEWAASVLAGLDCGFTIVRPDELRASVRALAERLACSAEARDERADP